MKKLFGLLAIAGLLMAAAPAQQAQALSLANPATSGTTRSASEGLVTQVRHGHGHWHGGRGWHRGHHHWHRWHHHRWHRWHHHRWHRWHHHRWHRWHHHHRWHWHHHRHHHRW